MQRFQLYYQGGENRWSLHFEWTSDKRVCWWPPMFSNQRCCTYIPWTPSTFLKSHCLLGLSFSWNVCLDSFVSLPGSLSERRSGVAQTSERETFWTPSEGWNFFFRWKGKKIAWCFTSHLQPPTQGICQRFSRVRFYRKFKLFRGRLIKMYFSTFQASVEY